MFECPGCAKRREAMAVMGNKVMNWMRRPAEPPPEIAPKSTAPPTAEQLARLAKLRELVNSKS